MWRHDQPVDLLVAIIGKREHRPIASGLARAHLDAADDAVGTGRGRDLHPIAVGALKLDGIGEIDRGGVHADIDRFDRGRAGNPEQGCEYQHRERRGGTTECQETTSELGSRRNPRPEVHKLSRRID